MTQYDPDMLSGDVDFEYEFHPVRPDRYLYLGMRQLMRESEFAQVMTVHPVAAAIGRTRLSRSCMVPLGMRANFDD